MIFDLHEDFIIRIEYPSLLGYSRRLEKHDYKQMEKTFYGIAFAIFPLKFDESLNVYSISPFEEAVRELMLYKEIVRQLRIRKKIFLLEGLYGLDGIKVKALFKLGVKVFGLTWNFGNEFASGRYDKKDYGLTERGEKIVDVITSLGGIVDLAHASRKTCLDVLSVVDERKVIVSHANLKKFSKAKRDIEEKVLERLAEKKGVLGLMFSKEMKNVENMLRQIAYIEKEFGMDVIAMGSDWYGLHVNELLALDENKENYSLVKFEKILLENYSRKEVEEITWKNAVRVLGNERG